MIEVVIFHTISFKTSIQGINPSGNFCKKDYKQSFYLDLIHCVLLFSLDMINQNELISKIVFYCILKVPTDVLERIVIHHALISVIEKVVVVCAEDTQHAPAKPLYVWETVSKQDASAYLQLMAWNLLVHISIQFVMETEYAR